jgi:uncharacterized protein (TIGR02118 family)
MPSDSERFVSDRHLAMVKLTVLYGRPTDPDEFDRYYGEVHEPGARTIPGLLRLEAGKVTTLDGSEAPYYLMAQLWFEDMAAFAAGAGSPEGVATAADVETFATGGTTMLLTAVE